MAGPIIMPTIYDDFSGRTQTTTQEPPPPAPTYTPPAPVNDPINAPEDGPIEPPISPDTSPGVVQAPIWLPGELGDLWVQAWIETGDPALAIDAVRRSEEYNTYFPGNRRDDGSLRYTELDYLSMVEGFEDVLLSVGLNPSVFREDVVGLVSGNVSVTEFGRRVDALTDRVLNQAPEIRAYYAETFGIEMTDAAIIGTVLSPALNDAVLSKQITVAEIGGQAALSGFGINTDLATSIYERGLDRSSASQLFSQAAEQLPILDILAGRHNDPDDDFDINEFTNAAIFDDQEQRSRIRRLLAAERASFGRQSQFVEDRARGAIVGLRSI